MLVDNEERAQNLKEIHENQEEMNVVAQAEGEREGRHLQEATYEAAEDQGEHLTDFVPDSEDELDSDSDPE